jgi:hypothetical protein
MRPDHFFSGGVTVLLALLIVASARAFFERGLTTENPVGFLQKDSRAVRIEKIRDQAPCDSPWTPTIQRHLEKGWDDRTLSHIACGSAFLGMTSDQARAAWGRPTFITRSNYSYGTREHWLFGPYGSGSLDFLEGVLVAIHN